MDQSPRTRCGIRLAMMLMAAVAVLPMAGCTLLGGMLESYRQTSTRTVDAEYTGLVGKSFAVAVFADRSIEAENPGLVGALMIKINDRLRQTTGASGAIDSERLVGYLVNNPRLGTKSRGELAADLGVQRLIVIDLYEYRLHDPGNRYLWDAVAGASVGVIEADGPAPDDYAFSRDIRVSFPDQKGAGPEDISRDLVTAALLKRLIDRTTWLFYSHEEPYYPTY